MVEEISQYKLLFSLWNFIWPEEPLCSFRTTSRQQEQWFCLMLVGLNYLKEVAAIVA